MINIEFWSVTLAAFGPGFNPALAVGSGAALLIFFLVLLGIVKSLVLVCPPNRALIIIGKRGRSLDGQTRGDRVLIGGRGFRLPLIQMVRQMSLTLMEVPIQVRNAYSKGGIAMNVDAIANVKIASDERVIYNAIERFLDKDVAEIRRVAKETLEGHLRETIAQLTPEQVNEDRLAFAERLTTSSEEGLQKLGLHLDTLKIVHVSDDVGYLDATGRKAIAMVIREAEIAESDARRSAEQSEAHQTGRANVTRANADANISRLRNELRKIRADLESTIQSEEERTSAAARQARAEAEQQLQAIRSELEAIRLQVERVLPAEADRQAQEFRARGQAALIRERGRALSEALEVMSESWQKAGDNAMQIALIEDVEKLIKTAAEGVQKVHVDQISVIDSGDGRTLPNYLASYPAMLESVFSAVENTTGINIPEAISGKKQEKEGK